MSLKKDILIYLESRKTWIHKGEIADYAKTLNYSAENAGRRCRELVNEGLVEASYNKNREVIYKTKEKQCIESMLEQVRAQDKATTSETTRQSSLFTTQGLYR